MTTNYVTEIASYSAVPNVTSAEAKSGSGMRLTPDGGFLGAYWNEFGAQCQYEAFIDGKVGKVVLTTKTGGKTVGAVLHGKGVLLFLPPISIDEEKLTKYNAKKKQTFWTTEAVKLGKRLSASLAALSDTLVAGRLASPPPSWATDIRFRMPREADSKAPSASSRHPSRDSNENERSLSKSFKRQGRFVRCCTSRADLLSGPLWTRLPSSDSLQNGTPRANRSSTSYSRLLKVDALAKSKARTQRRSISTS